VSDALPSREVFPLVCSGCGYAAPAGDPYPFRCPNAAAGDDIDHVLVRRLEPPPPGGFPTGSSPNPFIRYRELFRSHRLALAGGMTDAGYVDLVERLDKEIDAVDGHGFEQTPFQRADRLSDLLGFEPEGGVWVKDETGNVSGSHKARHLMGLLIHLRVAEGIGLLPEDGALPDLAIASCGNAALAAAVVAKAGGRRLQVFVPTSADPAVVRRLRELDAVIEVCPRTPGVPGDPTVHALRRALSDGALPFTCQGDLNGLAIEGGQTLGYEMVSQLAADGVELDRVFVQVGGGALASAVIAAFTEAKPLGAVKWPPQFHAVQTAGGYPLKRAYDLLARRILQRIQGETSERPPSARGEAGRAAFLRGWAGMPSVERELAYAGHHRSSFMWPWETEPASVAHGILDDETYDWLAVVRGMVATGGHPVVVDEDRLERANGLARDATGIDVDHTGSSGLAGLMQLSGRDAVHPHERVAVLFTGVRR
jgi:threonine synthase